MHHVVFSLVYVVSEIKMYYHCSLMFYFPYLEYTEHVTKIHLLRSIVFYILTTVTTFFKLPAIYSNADTEKYCLLP